MNHDPVLKGEVIEILSPKPSDTVLDCTLGLGGHAKLFLEEIGKKGKLVGIDADEENLKQASENLSEYSSQIDLHHGNFNNLSSFIINPSSFDVIFADLGVSSPHFDDPSRGFSFREDGPLDMRLDRSSGRTAAELIAEYSEEDLANVLYEYGEIRQSRKLASALKQDLPQTTFTLKDSCEHIFKYKNASMLPQVFQALRIEVNDELGALKSLLEFAPKLLKPGGRLGIIAFHSLEDRLVKQAFRKLSTPQTDDTTGATTEDAPFELVSKKAIKPTDEEIERNSRSRSARFRVMMKR